MSRRTLQSSLVVAALVALAGAGSLYSLRGAIGSDHADSPAVLARPGADLTDVYVFPAPRNDANVVVAVDVHPLIAPGMGASTYFDPGVMYQFKIDNTGDHVEDLVIQFSASAPKNGSQTITLYGPAKPNQTGTSSTWIAQTGTFAYNDKNATVKGMKVFAGPREDPFFFETGGATGRSRFTKMPCGAAPIRSSRGSSHRSTCSGFARPATPTTCSAASTWRGARWRCRRS